MKKRTNMQGSPYHIESMQYTYAVEHENSDIVIHEAKVKGSDCSYFVKPFGCQRWNSGYTKCYYYKCPYYNYNLRKMRTCNNCAYFYDNTCAHPRRRKNLCNEAEYCAFYVDRATDSDKYLKINQCIKRIELTKKRDKLEAAIKKLNQSIKSAKKENRIRSIIEKEDYIVLLENEKKRVEKNLKLCGGPWESRIADDNVN